MKLCGFEVGLEQPFFLICGPCAIETEQLALETASKLKEITTRLGIPFIYKSSFDKANRSSHNSARGVGLEAGLRILEKVKNDIGVPILTDVHEDTPLDEVASVVDVLQTPAFLCRQTNFIQNVARTGKPVNIKRGSSSRRGIWAMWLKKPVLPATSKSWCVNAVMLLVTII